MIAESQPDPATYDAWYETDRGRWIAGCELRLLNRLLAPRSGSTLLDIGCGTGHFTRGFAELGLEVSGLDPDLDALRFAQGRGTALFVAGDGGPPGRRRLALTPNLYGFRFRQPVGRKCTGQCAAGSELRPPIAAPERRMMACGLIRPTRWKYPHPRSLT